MRIIHVEDSFDPTAGYQVNELIKISHSGIEQIIITSKDMTPFHKELCEKEDRLLEEKYKIQIIRLDVLFKVSNRILMKGLWEKINFLNPDLLFLHGIGDFKDLRLFLAKPKYKVVRDCHMSWVGSINPFAKYFLILYSKIFSPIINNSNKYLKVYALGIEELQYLNSMGIKREKIEMLPHGYNKEFFYYDRNARVKIRSDLEVNESSIIITYIGKFDEHKRPDLIFEILDLASDDLFEKHDIKLLFIGSKKEEYMTRVFNERKKRSKFKGEIKILNSKRFEELKDWYSGSDICIWPKQTTLSSIHAQVCQTTVIMEKQVSNQERVVNDSNLFEIDNLEQASKILERIIWQKEYFKKDNLSLDPKLTDREYSNQFAKLISALD